MAQFYLRAFSIEVVQSLLPQISSYRSIQPLDYKWKSIDCIFKGGEVAA